MTDTRPTDDVPALNPPTTPWRCLVGATLAGALASGMYLLTRAIATSLASKPLPTVNATAVNIAVAVRTLVVGVATLGTGVFALASVGLLLLAGQLWLRRLPKSDPPS